MSRFAALRFSDDRSAKRFAFYRGLSADACCRRFLFSELRTAGADGISLQTWRWVIDVNLMGLVHGVRAFLPHLKSHGEGGHIVNTASMAGFLGTGFGPYTASKFAVVGISETLRAELAPHGIGVSVLCPGWVNTRILESRSNWP